ncbi:MAG: methionyl-tRNA formyltransferase [Acidobacteriia bacterium]|nr:methionyl-tRNA formyltransferase [Terriglobia bacterium]
MRIVFCGTPQFAVPALQYLHSLPEFEIAAVITQPDRPRGRGQEISFSPVKEAALAAGIPVYQPEKIRRPEAREFLEQIAPDVVAIIAYGQIIPEELLRIPRHGWINLHASLLPKYRGAAPINRAILNGETRTGLTTMRIDAGMDTGEMLLRQEMEIGPEETAPELAARMAEAGKTLMAETLRGLRDGRIVPRAQDAGTATNAPLLRREEGRIRWEMGAREIFNRMRGLAPWPGAFTTFRGQICHVWGAPLSDALAPAGEGPGRILGSNAELRVVCGGGTLLQLSGVKLEGRKRISAQEFASGMRLAGGEKFGE